MTQLTTCRGLVLVSVMRLATLFLLCSAYEKILAISIMPFHIMKLDDWQKWERERLENTRSNVNVHTRTQRPLYYYY